MPDGSKAFTFSPSLTRKKWEMLDLMGEWNKWLGRDVLKQENMHHLCEINDHLRVQMATTQEKHSGPSGMSQAGKSFMYTRPHYSVNSSKAC